MKKHAKTIALLLLVAAIAVAAIAFPVADWALAGVRWVRDAGAWGVALFALGYVVATVAFVPGSIVTLGAGFAYGLLGGTLLVSPASVTGATLAFLIARHLGRERISRRIGKSPTLRAIDRAIGEDGFRTVLLVRLSPVFPFSVLNYALGLTGVRTRDYVLASFLGMLPGTFLYVYLGTLITSAAELASGGASGGGPWRTALLVVGLVATIAVTVLITRSARRQLAERLDDEPATT